jgi:hypothetical protein
MNKTFILGIGAQKSGTTWLHRQLIKNSNIDMGFSKEYHVFDAIETKLDQELPNGKSRNAFRDNRIKKIIELRNQNQLGKNLGSNRKKSKKYAALTLSFIDNVDTYFDYFDYLHLKSPAIEIVGDITPSYALLSPKIFRLIQKGLTKRGFDIKILFLMRDPVERQWSAARMNQRNMNSQDKKTFDIIKNMLNRTTKKSCYEETINNVEKVFDRSQIYYGFYENLFTIKSNQKIEHFIGSKLKDFENSEIVNASPKLASIPDEINTKLVERYSKTYEFIEDRFGSSMHRLWQGYNIKSSI